MPLADDIVVALCCCTNLDRAGTVTLYRHVEKIAGVLTTAAIVSWARDHATQLEADMTFRQGDPGYGWWWEATSPAAESKIRARAYAALYFLDRFAGADSQWAIRAHTAFDKNSHSMETGARELGDVLRAWADQVEASIVPIRQVDAQGAGAIASSDLMEQVRMLLDEGGVHPAAPVVLAGAALEVALRRSGRPRRGADWGSAEPCRTWGFCGVGL